MFGLEGFGVIVGFVLTLLSTLICIIYGAKNWNHGHLDENEVDRKQAWLEEEQELEEQL